MLKAGDYIHWLKNMLKNIFIFFVSALCFLILLEALFCLAGHILLLKNYSVINNNDSKIFCYGDSFTYGIFVKSSDSYPSQLARMLKDDKRQIQVVNRGIPGMGSSLMLRKIKKDIMAYHPDCIVALIGMNDRDNMLDIIERESRGHFITSYLANFKIFKLCKTRFLDLNSKILTATPDGRLITGKTAYAEDEIQYLRSDVIPMRDKHLLLRKGIDFYEKADYESASKHFERILSFDPEDGDALLWLGRIYNSRMPKDNAKISSRYKDYIGCYRNNIKSLIKIAKHRNIPVILLTYPNWNGIDKILSEISADYKIPLINTKEGISDYLIPANYYTYFLKDNHPKKEVYHHMAKLVYNKLNEIGVVSN